jgi:Tfp pilus assembly protein PilX
MYALEIRQMRAVSGLRKQRGVALFVCLMILLILSLLGISALRMTMSQGMMAAGSLASNIATQAASSGINQAITDGENDLSSRNVLPTVAGQSVTRCLVAGQTTPGLTPEGLTIVTLSGACKDQTVGKSSDDRGVATTEVTIVKPDYTNDPASAAQFLAKTVQMGTVPGARPEAFVITATGSVAAVQVSATQVQEVFFPHL